MKISIISSWGKDEWEVDELYKAAHSEGIDVEIRDIPSTNDLDTVTDELGNIVIWRCATAKKTIEKVITMSLLKSKHKFVLNGVMIERPYMAYKLYQYSVLPSLCNIPVIPFWNFKTVEEAQHAIRKGLVKLPLIYKPYLASQGNGAVLITGISDVTTLKKSIRTGVFQTFIQNNGDYRIIVVGNRSTGCIKRVASKGSYLNNISRGARAYAVTDPGIVSIITDMALSVTKAFGMDFAAVDIIQDKNTGKYYFLELNTKGQWRGFQETTYVEVAKEIVRLCVDLYKRQYG